MNEEEALNRLKKEGYKEVYIWKDSPNFVYDKHCHEYETKLVMLEGKMVLEIDGSTVELLSGKDFVIPAWKYHLAKVSEDGARYAVGEDKE